MLKVLGDALIIIIIIDPARSYMTFRLLFMNACLSWFASR